MPKKRKKRLAIQPKELISKIQSLGLTKIQQDNSIHLCEIINLNQKKSGLLVDEYVPLPRKYLEEIYSDTRYMKWMNKLLEADIIKCDEKFYFGNNSKCKYYKINQGLLTENLTKIGYTFLQEKKESKRILTPTKEDNGNISELLRLITVDFGDEYQEGLRKSQIIKDIKSLYVDVEKLIKVTNDKIDLLKLKDFQVSDKLRDNKFITVVLDGNKEQKISLGYARDLAKKRGLSLLKDNDFYRITDAEKFLTRKRASIYNSYMSSIMRIKSGIINVNRNDTNNRMDSNITNMSSDLVGNILYDNNLVSIDLCNSQFAIFSYALGKSDFEDVNMFKQLSGNGMLYTYIMNELELENLKQAKNMCFELLFSSRKNNTPEKLKLKDLFPNVIAIIDSFKKTYGDNKFSIFLQKVESNLFIDCLLAMIRDNVGFCLSKHDSIIVREEDVEEVLGAIVCLFSELKIHSTFMIDYMGDYGETHNQQTRNNFGGVNAFMMSKGMLFRQKASEYVGFVTTPRPMTMSELKEAGLRV